ncbi:proto-oncogene Wnt-3-like [Platysternon megacephalum]|uniref:Methylmalonyl-CoA mutase n=1 Tax=Platysternon megacephalum TaxID=55544 RepID=A0A4D9E4X9_9SAUR|nr:methylmalonyl-CoA mutase [Platysternon megacephalum]TFK03298.1 proto-oncogene Wnt-3-like [Platysternon megacephalum]
MSKGQLCHCSHVTLFGFTVPPFAGPGTTVVLPPLLPWPKQATGRLEPKEHASACGGDDTASMAAGLAHVMNQVELGRFSILHEIYLKICLVKVLIPVLGIIL